MNVDPLVCLVDDAADYCFLVERIFKRHLPDYSLRLFVDGQAFLNALPHFSRKPSLVLLDQHMPQLSGYQTLVAIKQQTRYRSIPIVMMSRDASHSEIKSFYDAGASGFSPKPMDSDILKETLISVCQYASKP